MDSTDSIFGSQRSAGRVVLQQLGTFGRSDHVVAPTMAAAAAAATTAAGAGAAMIGACVIV